MPPQWLLGDEASVELYSAATFKGQANLICNPTELDELIEVSGGKPSEQPYILNFKYPRVRDRLAQTCLARPGDTLMAITPGQNVLVSIEQFFVAFDPPLCPLDSSYSLHAKYEERLPLSPFFISTNTDLKEGSNGFVSRVDMEKVPLREKTREEIRKKVAFAEDYEIEVYDIQAKNCDQIIRLRKKRIQPEDVGLPHEIIFWGKENEISELILERVEKNRNSGHVQLMGILDYNFDENIDLLIEGDQDQCPYKIIFEGRSRGFQAMDVPNRPCSC